MKLNSSGKTKNEQSSLSLDELEHLLQIEKERRKRIDSINAVLPAPPFLKYSDTEEAVREASDRAWDAVFRKRPARAKTKKELLNELSAFSPAELERLLRNERTRRRRIDAINADLATRLYLKYSNSDEMVKDANNRSLMLTIEH